MAVYQPNAREKTGPFVRVQAFVDDVLIDSIYQRPDVARDFARLRIPVDIACPRSVPYRRTPAAMAFEPP